MPSILRKYLIIIIFSLTTLVISGCDPHDPMGIREFAILQQGDGSNYEIIAVVPFWGPGNPDSFFITSDGGYSWKHIPFDYDSYYRNDNIRFNDNSGYFCTYDCEFQDLFDNTIMYQIKDGKKLYISTDNGANWKEIFEISQWEPIQKNYLRLVVAEELGPTPFDVRGPFDAITDPTTGNVLLAMGFEGIILIPTDGEWQWIKLTTYNESYKQIDFPNRFGMISLIPFQDRSKGILLFLFTFYACLQLNYGRKYSSSQIFNSGFMLLVIIILAQAIHKELVHYFAIGFFCLFLLYKIIVQKTLLPKVLQFIVFSIFPSIIFFSILMLWCQGIILSTYNTACFIATTLGMLSVVPVLLLFRRKKGSLNK